MASIKLFWNPDSPPCRLVWVLLRQSSSAFVSEVVSWSTLRDLTVSEEAGTLTGQIPVMQTASGSIADSLACVLNLHADAQNWMNSADFHIFRLAEIHVGRLLQVIYWLGHTFPKFAAPSVVAATTGVPPADTPFLAEFVKSELIRIQTLYQVICGPSVEQAPLSNVLSRPGMLALGIYLDFVEALSGHANEVLDAGIGHGLVWSRPRDREDLCKELGSAGAKVHGFRQGRWGAGVV